jgi:hypothetical protein
MPRQWIGSIAPRVYRFGTYIISQVKGQIKEQLGAPRVFRAARAAPARWRAGEAVYEAYCTSVTRKRVMDWRWPIFLR